MKPTTVKRKLTGIVSYLLTDFHIAVAASTMILGQGTQGAGADSMATSMSHLSRTFQLINRKLADTTEEGGHGLASDATIAVVIFMALYERHLGRWLQGLVHLRGLQHMVALRGGLTGLLKESPAVAHKILR